MCIRRKVREGYLLLHVSKKKSTSGISTPQREIETVRARYKRAQELYTLEFGSEETA
jgi:phage-related protein